MAPKINRSMRTSGAVGGVECHAFESDRLLIQSGICKQAAWLSGSGKDRDKVD